jgi:phosphosulfolactate synthase
MNTFLNLPNRAQKPRSQGMTVLIDNGYPLGFFKDVLSSHKQFIDTVKVGWGTAYIDSNLAEKIKYSQSLGINVFMGGTFFEKAALQNKLDSFIAFLKDHGIKHMEISNGTINLTNTEKAHYIKKYSTEFEILSEVGFKDSERSQELHPAKWIEYIQEDFDAGSTWVITEARESGTSGICRSDGEIRFGLINEIASSGINLDKMIYEAPNKRMQEYFITHFGANVNLANIAFTDVTSLETLRVGLRGDTLMLFEASDKVEAENML